MKADFLQTGDRILAGAVLSAAVIGAFGAFVVCAALYGAYRGIRSWWRGGNAQCDELLASVDTPPATTREETT